MTSHPKQNGNPWLELADRYKDDPMFKEMLAEIEKKQHEESTEHPWMKFAGMFKDDPHWNEFIEDMAAYRRELDAVTTENAIE